MSWFKVTRWVELEPDCMHRLLEREKATSEVSKPLCQRPVAEPSTLSLTPLSHSIPNDFGFQTPGPLEASCRKEHARTWRRWHHDNTSDG